MYQQVDYWSKKYSDMFRTDLLMRELHIADTSRCTKNSDYQYHRMCLMNDLLRIKRKQCNVKFLYWQAFYKNC